MMNQTTAKPGFDCPSCGVGLVMTDRQGIEIDYCPQCRGVWLDRGELDKIIERSQQPAPAAAQPQPGPFAPVPPPQQQTYGHAPPGPYRDHRDREYGHQGKYKRRKSFLEELFD
jgi:Zn-finger nucleic acid-binding protein